MNMINNHNKLLSIILEWGKTHLLTPVFTQYLDELEQNYQFYLTGTDFKEFLLESSLKIEVSAFLSMQTLSNPELITASEGDKIWDDVEESFVAFDKVVYFSEALHHLINHDNKDVCEEKLNQLMMEISSWLEDGDFSPLRLTVLNGLRSGTLKLIPEDKRYLFPWYEIYSDYDENILAILVENYDKFATRNEIKHIPEILSSCLAEISYELKRDLVLFSAIKQEVILHRSLLEAASRKSALTLWQLGDNAAIDYILPECVVNAGVVRVSIKAIKKAVRPISSKADKVYWTFLAAFCGTGLTDSQRITLLDKVETILDRIDTSDVKEEGATQIISQLKRWYKGEYIDSWLISTSFETWLRYLESNAMGLPAMDYDEEPNQLWDIMQNLLNEAPIFERLIAKISSWVSEGLILPQLQAAIMVPMGEQNQGTELQPSLVIDKPINLTLKPNTNGEYIFLTSPDSRYLSSCDNRENYNKLWDSLLTSSFFWGGCAVTGDNKIDTFSTQAATRRTFKRLQSDNYQNAIIGISSDRENLNKFISKLTNMEDKQKQSDESFNVILLICTLQRGDNQ